MTFYINEVHLDGVSDWDHRCIGLFDSNNFDGRGSFCGWYGAEYYLDTTLLAYGVQLVDGGSRYNPYGPFDGGVYEVNKHFDEVKIGSCMCEIKFEADSVEEAVELFITRRW